MGHKWIIDVIADLHTFADQNGLPLLAAQLDISAIVARSEIASPLEGGPHGATATTGQLAPPFGERRSGQIS